MILLAECLSVMTDDVTGLLPLPKQWPRMTDPQTLPKSSATTIMAAGTRPLALASGLLAVILCMQACPGLSGRHPFCSFTNTAGY